MPRREGLSEEPCNLQAIPSADDVPSDVALDALKKIPEFLNQLEGSKDKMKEKEDDVASVVEIE